MDRVRSSVAGKLALAFLLVVLLTGAAAALALVNVNRAAGFMSTITRDWAPDARLLGELGDAIGGASMQANLYVMLGRPEDLAGLEEQGGRIQALLTQAGPRVTEPSRMANLQRMGAESERLLAAADRAVQAREEVTTTAIVRRGVTASMAIDRLSEDARALAEGQAGEATLSQLLLETRALAHLGRAGFLRDDYLFAGQPEVAREMEQELALAADAVDELLALAGQDPRRLAGLREAASGIQQAQEELDRLIELRVELYDRGAVALSESALELANLDRETLDSFWADIDALGRQIERSAATTRVLLVGAFAVALAAGGLVLFLIARGVTLPLGRLTDVAGLIAAGDLTPGVEVRSRDEVGRLSRAFDTMTQGLRQVLSQVQGAAGNVTSAAAEILASTTQQASGASEQSAAVAQTTSTVEEVRQTAEQTVERAREIAQMAESSVRASEAGTSAVEATVSGMDAIRQRVESIAQNILDLSEQSQRIGEIVEAVNEIADQSNLLALNAAIEAARAGEQGKGFAVVANEVRSLAEQSREATGQIEAILGDIQKSINATVMATEQGTKGVEEGIGQAERAGEAIRELAESIERYYQAAQQIVASASQQMVGMDQVTKAISDINQAATQSLASTQQAERAAQDLNRLASELGQMVSTYRVDGAGRAAAEIRPGSS